MEQTQAQYEQAVRLMHRAAELYALADDDPSAARTGTRQVWWPEDEGAVTGAWIETSIFDADALAPGNRITGPAVVEADLTTIVVPPGMTYAIDEHGLGILERIEAREHVELTDTVAVGSSSAAVVDVTGGTP